MTHTDFTRLRSSLDGRTPEQAQRVHQQLDREYPQSKRPAIRQEGPVRQARPGSQPAAFHRGASRENDGAWTQKLTADDIAAPRQTELVQDALGFIELARQRAQPVAKARVERPRSGEGS
jgi:hypothetical protein